MLADAATPWKCRYPGSAGVSPAFFKSSFILCIIKDFYGRIIFDKGNLPPIVYLWIVMSCYVQRVATISIETAFGNASSMSWERRPLGRLFEHGRKHYARIFFQALFSLVCSYTRSALPSRRSAFPGKKRIRAGSFIGPLLCHHFCVKMRAGRPRSRRLSWNECDYGGRRRVEKYFVKKRTI